MQPHQADTLLIWNNKDINSLAPGRFQFNFRLVIFKLTLVNGSWSISYEIALRWMPLDLTDDKSTIVQVMACCHQATSHYLSQCWARSMSPNGFTRPHWVNQQDDDYPVWPYLWPWLWFSRLNFENNCIYRITSDINSVYGKKKLSFNITHYSEVIMSSPGLFFCMFVCLCLSRCLSRWYNYEGLMPHKQYFARK